jgi:polysaccharide pyruvyl transferase WcaK-like protein
MLHPGVPFGIAAHARGDAPKWGVDHAAEITVSSWFAKPRLTGWIGVLRAAVTYERLIFIGTDVFDGSYSDPHCWVRLLRAADYCGMETRVVSFSCSESPQAGAVETLRSLPPTTRLFSRDPISEGRSQALLGRPVEASADLAFLLPCGTTPLDRVAETPASTHAQSGPRIGLNINPALIMRSCNVSLSKCVSDAAALIAMLVTELNATVVLIPHDSRGRPNEPTVAQRVRTDLPPSIAARCSLSTAASASDVKLLVRSLDVVVTGRMHLAVAALGEATPVLCASYMEKVEGLYERCGVPELVFASNLFATPHRLVALVGEALRRQSDIVSVLRSRLPCIERLALRCLT